MRYDPNESKYPPIGEQIRVIIGQCEESRNSKGKAQLILNVMVDAGQPGADYETKFYAQTFHIGDIMRAVGMDTKAPRDVDALTFRDKMAYVTFRHENWTNKDGEAKVSTKIDRWIPLSQVDTGSEADTEPASEPDPDMPPPPSADDEPVQLGDNDPIPF